jgi:hypothetical protein
MYPHRRFVKRLPYGRRTSLQSTAGAGFALIYTPILLQIQGRTARFDPMFTFKSVEVGFPDARLTRTPRSGFKPL